MKLTLGSTQSSGFFIRYVAVDIHITLNIVSIIRVVITEYSALHHSIKGEKITLIVNSSYRDYKTQKEIYDDYRLFDKDVYLYPAKDIIFFTADIHGNAIMRDRLSVLRRLIEGLPTTIITTIECGMDNLLPLDYLKNNYYLCKITLINLEFDDEIIR